MIRTRKQAFESESSPSWCPELGGEVWVARLRGSLCWCAGRGVVKSIMAQAVDPLVCVVLRTKRAVSEVVLIPSELRPVIEEQNESGGDDDKL